MSVHETARPIHLTDRDRWLTECSCGWEQLTRTEIEARLAWKNHKAAMDEQHGLRLSNDRLRNEARDPDVASIEEAFLYIAPVHESVVRDARAALRRIVEEIDRWHREALDWQQAKSEGDSDYEECATQRDMARERADGYKRDFLAASERRETAERDIARIAAAAEDFLRSYIDASVNDEEGLLAAIDEREWSAMWHRVDERAKVLRSALARLDSGATEGDA